MTMTKAEAYLWKQVLKFNQIKGYGFRRQRPVLNDPPPAPASGGQLSIQAKMRIPNNVTWGI